MSSVFTKIFTLTLLTLLAIGSALGQVAGTKQPEHSALELAFQKPARWNGNKYSEPMSFLERTYVSTGITSESIWGVKDATGNSANGVLTTLVVGHKVSPIHTAEVALTYGVLPYADWEISRKDELYNTSAFMISAGVEFRYLFNVSAYALRRESPTKFELYGSSSLSLRRQGSDLSIGTQFGLRGQYNLSSKLSLYVEPRIGYHDNNYDAGEKYNLLRGHFATSVTGGISVALNMDEGYRYIGKERNERIAESKRGEETNPAFAIKTNAVYWAMAAPNVGVEIPIGGFMSLCAEYIFPWYGNRTAGYLYQVQMADVELRYWLDHKSKLQGWFVGGHASRGYYDVQYKEVGYQGQSYKAYGITAGFSQPIARGVSVEGSLGFGSFTTDYEKYGIDSDCLVFVHGVTLSALNVTKAMIGVVWTPTIRKKR